MAGRYNEAVEGYHAGTEFEGTRREGYVQVGTLLAGFEEYEAALIAFNSGLSGMPGEPTLLRRRALVQVRRGNLTGGVADLQTLVDNDTANAQDLATLGSLYEARGDTELAIQAYLESLKLNDSQFTALVNLSLIRAGEEDYPVALELAERAIAIDTDHLEAQHVYGWALIHTDGREAEGRAVFDQLAEVSQNPNMLTRQAILLAREGASAEATTLADAALAIRSDFELAEIARDLASVD